jgi:hypothetical protein
MHEGGTSLARVWRGGRGSRADRASVGTRRPGERPTDALFSSSHTQMAQRPGTHFSGGMSGQRACSRPATVARVGALNLVESLLRPSLCYGQALRAASIGTTDGHCDLLVACS